MIKAIFLDMDDTLVFTQVLYEQGAAMLYGYLRNFGILPQETKQVFDAVDKELYKTYGVSRERLPSSFEAVLKHFVPEADAEMVDIVRGFANDVFDSVANIKPGVPEAIDLLTSNYPVYIVTAGDKGVQQGRLKHLPFKDKFTGTFIVPKKDKETYAGLAQKLGFACSEVVMIGDGLTSDIIPSVAAGMQAVWIEAHNSPHEVATGLPEKRAYKFSSLLEAARQIVQKGTLVTPKVVPSPKRKLG
jgi:HAD superfamily hydrolase (TIGR01549 family)